MGDTFYFHDNAGSGKLSSGNASPSRHGLRKILADQLRSYRYLCAELRATHSYVGLIHSGKVVHVGKVDVVFHHLLQGRTREFENLAQVVEDFSLPVSIERQFARIVNAPAYGSFLYLSASGLTSTEHKSRDFDSGACTISSPLKLGDVRSIFTIMGFSGEFVVTDEFS